MLTKYQWTKCSRAGRFVQNQVVSPRKAQQFCVSRYYQNLLNAIIPVIMTKCGAISYSMNSLPNSHEWFKHYLSEGKTCLTEWCQSLFNYTVNKYDSRSIFQDVTVTMNPNYFDLLPLTHYVSGSLLKINWVMPVVVPKIVGYEIMWICCMIIKQLHFIFHMIERDLKKKKKQTSFF